MNILNLGIGIFNVVMGSSIINKAENTLDLMIGVIALIIGIIGIVIGLM